MRLAYTLIAALISTLSVFADSYTYNFHLKPLSDALAEMQQDHPELNINFIYDELENYRTSARVDTDNPYEAIRIIVGLNPVAVSFRNNNFFIEALQHGKYCYRGRIVDTEGNGLPAATTYALSPKDSTVITYGVTDSNGFFILPCDRTGIILKSTYIGYQTKYTYCRGFSIGTIVMEENPIMLNTVTIEGQNASLSNDKTVYMPTSRQKNAAKDAVDLLMMMAIPQIKVNRINKNVTDNFGEEVSIFINYMKAATDEITGLRTADVRKVEYLEFPTDPRFRGAQRVINIIVQEYAYGGYTKLTADENFLLGLSSMTSVFSKFSYKRMTYDLFFGANNWEHTHDGSSTKAVYSLLKDGTPVTVNRNEILEESKFTQNQYPVTFRASYNSDKIQIRNTVGFSHLANPRIYQKGTLNYLPEISEDYTYERNAPQRDNSASYSGSYFFSLPRDFSIDVAPVFNYTHTNASTEYSASNSTDIQRNAREDAYNFRVDGFLRKTIGQKHSLMAGINGGRWSSNLHYSGTNNYHDKFRSDFMGVLTGYNFQAKKFTLNLDMGYAWEGIDINRLKNNDWYPFTHINIRYSLNTKNLISAYFQYASNTPGVTEKTSDILRDNELLYISGNPKLKNSRHTTFNIAYTWLPTNSFWMSAYGRYFGLYNRMFRTYFHYDNGEALIRTWINDGDYLSGTIGMAFNWKLLNGNLQFYANPELYHHKITGSCPLKRNHFLISVQAIYYLKKFYFEAYYMNPQQGLRFETNTIYHNRNLYSLSAGWSNSDWNISLSAYNMFNKGWKNATWEFKTPLYSEVRTNYGNYYHPRINLSVTYTFGYGKKVQRKNEVGEQSGAKSAIIK